MDTAREAREAGTTLALSGSAGAQPQTRRSRPGIAADTDSSAFVKLTSSSSSSSAWQLSCARYGVRSGFAVVCRSSCVSAAGQIPAEGMRSSRTTICWGDCQGVMCVRKAPLIVPADCQHGETMCESLGF